MNLKTFIARLKLLEEVCPDADVKMADNIPVVDPVLYGNTVIITDQTDDDMPSEEMLDTF
jgi:hypothetical protein